MENFSIDFYSKSEAAVTITWASGLSDKGVVVMDSLLFGCYLIRQFRNLGKHPSNDALMKEVMNWVPKETSNLESLLGWTVYPEISHEKHIIFHAGISVGIKPERAEYLYGQEILLVPFHGRGDKVFSGELYFKNENPIFLLHVSGFGALGWNIPLFATDSVFHLLIALCKKYPLDQNYPKKLIGIAQDCVLVYKNNIVTSMNQEIIALNIVTKHLYS